jgi:hypothetical protein
MPAKKDTTGVTVHHTWYAYVAHARKTGDLTWLARVLSREPHHLYPGDLQLLGKLLARSRLIAKDRGPKSSPIAAGLNRAVELYRARSEGAAAIKRLGAGDRTAAIAAEASFHGLMPSQFERYLFDRETRVKMAADFANVTVEQLEQRLKRGPRKPAKR